MHEAVHQEGGPRQVAGVLHHRHQQIEDKDDRGEAEHGGDAQPHPIHQEAPHQLRSAQPRQQRLDQPRLNGIEEGGEQLLQAAPQQVDGLEHGQHDGQKQQRAHQRVKQHPVDAAAGARAEPLGDLDAALQQGAQASIQGFGSFGRLNLVRAPRGPDRWRRHLIPRALDGPQQRVQALARLGVDRQHRHAQAAPQFGGVDADPEATGLIAHVEGQQHGDAQGLDLQGQGELGGDLAGVDHHQGQIRWRVLQETAHDRLVFTASAEVVDARQVHQLEAATVGGPGQITPQQIHGQAGPVGDMGMAAGEPAVERRFAGVRQPQQGHAGRVGAGCHRRRTVATGGGAGMAAGGRAGLAAAGGAARDGAGAVSPSPEPLRSESSIGLRPGH